MRRLKSYIVLFSIIFIGAVGWNYNQVKQEKILILIFSTLNSQYVPNRSLEEINSKPIVQWVYDSAVYSKVGDVLIASNDERIIKKAQDFHGNTLYLKDTSNLITEYEDPVPGLDKPVVISSVKHDIVRETVRKIGVTYDKVVVLLDTMPFISVDEIKNVIDQLDDEKYGGKLNFIHSFLRQNSKGSAPGTSVYSASGISGYKGVGIQNKPSLQESTQSKVTTISSFSLTKNPIFLVSRSEDLEKARVYAKNLK